MKREYGDTFGRRLWRWLERFGFSDNPFALYEADQERSFLPYFFVDRAYLHDILGDPSRPQVAFLLAGRGAGKSATREMVVYECSHGRLRRRALAVRYDDFGTILEQVRGDVEQITPRHHALAIVRATLRTMAEDVPPTYFDLLDLAGRSLLAGYARAFADPISHLKLGQMLHAEPIQIEWESLSPKELLESMSLLVRQLGASSQVKYQALYMLVDRVDETAAGPEAAADLLKPLVVERPMLETPGVAFKFFLPMIVGQQLQQAVALRPDRVSIRTITWNEVALQSMVRQRLSYYSEGRIEHFEQLCTSNPKGSVMGRLIQVCEGSPRTLLRLCNALINHHVASANENNSTLITNTDLIETITDFRHQLETEQLRNQPVPEHKAAAASSVIPPASGLHLDDAGHVWVDGAPLIPSLSSLEYQLLRTLYRQQPEIVSNEKLIEAVWPATAWTSTDGDNEQNQDDQNLRKLITRLRGRLANNPHRFIKNARGRGYWLSVRESPAGET